MKTKPFNQSNQSGGIGSTDSGTVLKSSYQGGTRPFPIARALDQSPTYWIGMDVIDHLQERFLSDHIPVLATRPTARTAVQSSVRAFA